MKNALAMTAPTPAPTRQRPADDTKNRGELNNINIEITENGCIVRCSFDPKELNPKLDRYSQQPEDEKFSFDSMEKAKVYVGEKLDKQAAYEDEEGAKPAKAAPAGKKAAAPPVEGEAE